MTRFLLIRHANTAANGRRLSGRMAGVHLDEEGRHQAQALAARLASVPIAAIYASPLERAVETAEIVAKLRGREVVLREDMLEIDFGEWTGCSFEELSTRDDFQRFNALRSCASVPGGETMLQAQARMVAGMARLRLEHPHDCIAVVSHGDMIKSAIAYYAGIPLDLFQRIEIGPASVSVIDIDQAAVRIVCINDLGGPGAHWQAS